MNKKRIPAIVLSGLFLTGAAVILLVYLFSGRETRSLDDLLVTADEFIARAYVTEANEILDRAFSRAVTADDMLAVLKRSLILAEIRKDFRGFKEYARRAFEKNPGSSELCRIALYAFLRDGDADGALALRHGFASLPDVQALTAEAVLRTGKAADETTLRTIPLYQDYLLLEKETDPERFVVAGRVLGDERFFLDAALLYLEAGKIDTAYETAEKNLFSPQFDEVAGMIAYEKGDNKRALERLSRAALSVEDRPDLFIMLGDLSLLTGNREKAARAYERAIELKNDYSAIPYINLSWIMRQQGLEEKAFFLLNKACELFPGDKNAIVEYAKLLYHRGEKERALKLIDTFLDTEPLNDDVRLLKIRLRMEDMSHERALLELKDFFFENPSNERAAAVLVATLLKNRDIEGARTVVIHFGEVSGGAKKAWLVNAEGVFLAVAGDLEKAGELFSDALLLQERWDIRYNRSVINRELGRLDDAEKDLEIALLRIESSAQANDVILKARLHAGLALVFLKKDNLKRAAGEIDAALKYDPKNADAYSIRKKLEDSR